jgi:hypothetical protein
MLELRKSVGQKGCGVSKMITLKRITELRPVVNVG